jgi:uncharacterized damage-inducible protein DinB
MYFLLGALWACEILAIKEFFMPDLSLVHRMTAYTAWADDVMLRNAEQLSEAELSAPRDALFRSITGTFDHTLVVAEIFKAHIEGKSHPHTARHRDTVLPFDAVAGRLRAMNDHYVALARRWTETELAEVISFEFVGGGEGRMSREDILLHFVNHATYHRGFVSTLLFQLKTKGAASDLTVFLRDIWPEMSSRIGEAAQ